MSDFCLLADVFEDYRETCLSAYKLDTAYFLSAPQLLFNALLRFIKLPIECINDGEMYHIIQPAIRGGICHASIRYARANNKYMGSLYRPNEKSILIIDFDATNLYGLGMLQDLPYSEFTWLTEE